MKIVWITSVYPSTDFPGNGVFHETQVKSLVALGAEIIVINPIPSNLAPIRLLKKKYRRKAYPFLEERDGVKIYRPVYTAYPGQLRWAQPDKRIAKVVIDTIKEQGIEFDLMHAHFAMPSGGAANIVATYFQKPWILTLHGSDVHIYPTFSKGAEAIFKRTVLAADKVIAVGAHLAQAVERKTGRQSIVIPIGIDLRKFQYDTPSKGVLRKLLQLPAEQKLILFVGRLVKEKGVFELAESLKHLPEDVSVVFVGDGPAKQQLTLNEFFGKRLFLIGEIPNHQVKEYLLACDLFALPSYSEGMPTVIIEAISVKVPVLCTAVGGVPDLFGKHRDVLIHPQSVKEIVERYEEYATHRIDVKMLVEDLYTHIQAYYDVSVNAKRLWEEYKEMCKPFHT